MENQHRAIKDSLNQRLQRIRVMDDITAQGEQLGALVATLKQMPELDQRWVSIGATDLQKGLMALMRAVAKRTTF